MTRTEYLREAKRRSRMNAKDDSLVRIDCTVPTHTVEQLKEFVAKLNCNTQARKDLKKQLLNGLSSSFKSHLSRQDVSIKDKLKRYALRFVGANPPPVDAETMEIYTQEMLGDMDDTFNQLPSYKVWFKN